MQHNNQGYSIGWQIEGFFGTKKGIDYLNDIIGRVTITLNDLKPNRQLYKPCMNQKLAHYYPKIYKLLAFKGIESLKKKDYAPNRADNFDDYCFWAIKLYTEDLIREYGEGIPVPFSLIDDWAYNQFLTHKKGLSTVRAKCRSIWNWYDKENWTLSKSYIKKYQTEEKIKELFMTRQERARSNAKAKAEKARKAVFNAITGLYSDEYKKKNGKWHILKIAEATGLHRTIVSKYLKIYDNIKPIELIPS